MSNRAKLKETKKLLNKSYVQNFQQSVLSVSRKGARTELLCVVEDQFLFSFNGTFQVLDQTATTTR